MKKLTLNLLTLSCVAILTGCASDQHIIVVNSHLKPAKINTTGSTTSIEVPDSSNTSNTSKAITDSDNDAGNWSSSKSNTKTNDTDNISDEDAKKASDDLWARFLGRKDTKSDDDNDWGSSSTDDETNNATTPSKPQNIKNDDDWEGNEEEDDVTAIRKLIKAQKEITALKTKLTQAEEKLANFEKQEGSQGDELTQAQKEIETLKAKLAKAESKPKQPKPAKESEFFTTLKQGNAFELDGTGAMAGKMKTTNVDGSTVFNGVVLTIDDLESQAEGETVLSIDQGVKNGRSATDSLTTFKLDDTTEITLTNLADGHIRALRASDFSQGTFLGLGFVGSSNIHDEHGVRYGVYSTDGKSILFANGKPAERAFEGRYMGNAIYGKEGKYKMLKDAMTAIVSLNDRQNHTGKIDIAINVGGGEILNFGGDVLGNTFEGNRGDAETKGGFYGNGGDMAGVFHVTKEGTQQGYNGVFGGSHQ